MASEGQLRVSGLGVRVRVRVRVRVASKSRDYGLDFLCYDFSEELFIESNRCEEFGLTQIFFKNVPTVLNCVVLMKNVSHGREMEGI